MPSSVQYYPDAVDDVSAFGGSGDKSLSVRSTAIQGPNGCNPSEGFQNPFAECGKTTIRGTDRAKVRGLDEKDGAGSRGRRNGLVS